MYRVAKDARFDSLDVRVSDGLPLVPITVPITTAPEAGSMIYDPVTNRPYYANGTVWAPLDGAITSITVGTGLTSTQNPIVTSATLSMADTAVTPGSYGSGTQVPVITVDQQGRLTAAANVNIALTAWEWVFTGDPGIVYPPFNLMPLWDTLRTGATNPMVANGTFVAPAAGTYQVRVTVATFDLISDNSCTLVHTPTVGPAVGLSSDVNPVGRSLLTNYSIVVLGAGDTLHVQSDLDGVTTAGTSVAPFTSSGSIFSVIKIA